MTQEGEAPKQIAAAPIRRARYLQPLEYYPGHFQALLGLAELPVRVRALKGWIADGRDATPPELPPFDEPRSLKDWWMRHKKNRAPDWIVALAALAPPAEAPAAPAPLGQASLPLGSPPAPAAATSAPPRSATGFLASLQRQRAAEAATGEIYNSLLAAAAVAGLSPEDQAHRSAAAEAARRSWDDNRDGLREMERDAEKILAATGRNWLADDVIASHEVIHLTLKEGLYGLLRRIRPKLKSCATSTEEDKLWQEEIEKLFAIMRTSKFTALPDEAAA